MSVLDKLFVYIENMDECQRQLVLSFIVTLFDIDG